MGFNSESLHIIVLQVLRSYLTQPICLLAKRLNITFYTSTVGISPGVTHFPKRISTIVVMIPKKRVGFIWPMLAKRSVFCYIPSSKLINVIFSDFTILGKITWKKNVKKLKLLGFFLYLTYYGINCTIIILVIDKFLWIVYRQNLNSCMHDCLYQRVN